MPEGRVINNGSTLTQEYIITDQQGNARISFQNNGSGSAVVTQENSYYGFGLQLLNSPIGLPPIPNKQLYNGGSEWQNDYSNLPDYYQTFFRNYDAATGRFIGQDPDAEGAESLSVYQYAGNMPMMLNDPMGDHVVPGNTYNYNYVSPLMPNSGPLNGNDWQNQGAFTDYLYQWGPILASGGAGLNSDGTVQPYSPITSGNGGQDSGVNYNFSAGGQLESVMANGSSGNTFTQSTIESDETLYDPIAEQPWEQITYGFKSITAGQALTFLLDNGGGTVLNLDDSQSESAGTTHSITVDWDTGATTIVHYAANGVKISDESLTATSVVRIVGEVKNVRWSGVKALDVVGDVTGISSVIIDGSEAIDEFSSGNWRMGLWDTLKAAGTTTFLLVGGEEATLAVRGGELLWNLGTMVIDNNR